MNRLLSALALVSLLLQPNTGAIAQSNSVEQRTFKLEQETTSFDLEHKEVEPVFETQQVPDTCYRSVQRGTKTECHTEYDQQCSTRIENECRNVAYPVCQSVPRQVCENIPRRVCNNVPQEVCETTNDRVCRNEPQRVCTNVPRRQCDTVQQCTTQNDRVCRGSPPNQTCQDVPRRVCNPVQQCRTENDNVCHSEDRQVCQNVPRRQCHTENRQQCSTTNDSVCHTENRQECHNEYRQECNQVPRQSCVDVPRQACAEVPNIVQEPYACTRDVQVQTGERTKLRVGANIKVVIANIGKIELNSDEFVAKLVDSDVVLSLGKTDQKMIYRLVKKDRSEQILSETEKQIQVTFVIELISLDQLAALNTLKVIEPKLTYEKLQFKFSSELPQLFSLNPGHLEVVMVKGRRLYTIIDQVFDPGLVLKKVGDVYELSFSSFNVRYLNSRNHQIKFELGVNSLINRNELLNPELLDRVSFLPIRGEFEGFPTN